MHEVRSQDAQWEVRKSPQVPVTGLGARGQEQQPTLITLFSRFLDLL